MGVSQLREERHPLFYRILHEIIMASILFLIVTSLSCRGSKRRGGELDAERMVFMALLRWRCWTRSRP